MGLPSHHQSSAADRPYTSHNPSADALRVACYNGGARSEGGQQLTRRAVIVLVIAAVAVSAVGLSMHHGRAHHWSPAFQSMFRSQRKANGRVAQDLCRIVCIQMLTSHIRPLRGHTWTSLMENRAVLAGEIDPAKDSRRFSQFMAELRRTFHNDEGKSVAAAVVDEKMILCLRLRDSKQVYLCEIHPETRQLGFVGKYTWEPEHAPVPAIQDKHLPQCEAEVDLPESLWAIIYGAIYPQYRNAASELDQRFRHGHRWME